MDELIKELTLLAQEARAYLAKVNSPMLDLKPCKEEKEEKKPEPTIGSVQPKKTARRKPKVKVPVAPEIPVNPKFAALDEKAAEAMCYEYGKRLIVRFPEPGTMVDGQPAPQGYHMGRKILEESFKADRIAKLNHQQRLQFMTLVEEKLSPASTATGTPENPEIVARPADPTSLGI